MNDPLDNPNLISGIHNYCDRWCERCPFTSRCAVYAMEEADPDVNPAARDITNEAFSKKLAAIFAETHAMISEMAEELGIDLSAEALEPIRQQHEIERQNARNHPLARAAEDYARAVSQWFEQVSSKQEVVSDTRDEGSFEHAFDDDEDEFVAVIRWYQYVIAAKLVRAFRHSVDEDDDLDDDYKRDSDGSAKVALIAIDRSISAWKLLHDSLNEKREPSDGIQDLLVDLEKLRRSVEREWPDARDFIRPGFDEASLDVVH